jgi:hypothetical protein
MDAPTDAKNVGYSVYNGSNIVATVKAHSNWIKLSTDYTLQ